MTDIARAITRMINGRSLQDITAFAKDLGMTLRASPPNPHGDYKWFSFVWEPFSLEVNVMEASGKLRRTEFVFARNDVIDNGVITDWRSSFTQQLGPPDFSGGFRDDGFPDDEDGLDATVWRLGEKSVVLLNRKEDSETPAELVLVVKQ